ncbi:hypothetical protein N7504_006575 [Penicillium tannophilum]|nr:hypothetical protein N7504_006575 [Penicillium tannophilum]
MDYPAADNSDGFSRVEEDDLDADSDLSADELEVQPEIRIDEIERIEAFLFQTNAFQVMERSLFDFVYPSLRSILMKWISKKRRLKELTPKQLRNLEVAVSELQHIAPGRISVSLHDTPSVMNNIKGKWESFTAETWYWGPFKPYMRPLATGEARLHWRCVTCGKPRWAEVPLSFAKSVTGATKSLAQSNAPETISVQTSPDPQNFNASVLGQAGQDPDQNNVNKNLGHGPIHSRTDSNRRAEPEDDKLDLHVFLVMKHLSVFRSGYRLFQTQVKHMRDDDFFSWMRTTYYSQRGFFLAWFGISRYSHCEFFKVPIWQYFVFSANIAQFRRFGQSKYTPLIPEYPSTQQASYHYYPKPMDPLPPLSPHEFEDFFQGQAWHFTAARRLAQRFSRSGRDDTHENVIVNEILPKRDTILEEEDSSREVFWGLYVVENRSIPMLIFYSFVSMVPSIYFFFAWLFQWGHRGDLQNASVPLAVSLGFLGTFWGCIVLSSPSFQSPPNIH